MKKGILSLLLAISSLFAMAQCIPSPTGLNAGFHPDNDNIPCVVQNQAYSQAITFQNWDSIIISGFPVAVNYLIIDSILNLPCGISWSTNFINNRLEINESGCIFFDGTTTDTVGEYKLKVKARLSVMLLPGAFPWDFDANGMSLYLRVKANAAAVCPPVDTTASAILQTSTCDLGYVSTTFNTVRGKVYVDTDSNGMFNGNDYGLAWYPVKIDTANYVYTSSNGDYLLNLPIGIYNVAPASNSNYVISSAPNQYTFNFTGGGVDTLNNDFGLSVVNPFSDLSITLSNSNLRLGSPAHYSVNVRNLGTVRSSSTVNLLFDTLFTVTGVYGNPLSQSPGKVTWAVTDIDPGQSRYFSINVTTPVIPSLSGTFVNATAYIDSVVGDIDVTNDTFVKLSQINGPYDPNDKTAYPDVLSQEFVDGNKYIVYRIRFQNTGNDTAFNITVRDTINSPFLDVNSIQLLSASHDYKFHIEDGNICVWEFQNILLPDSNVNEPGSHGYIFFRIRVKNAGVTHGTEILNQAGIYFDFNPVVMTDPSIARADFESGIRDITVNNFVTIQPNPAQNRLVVKHAQWQQGASIVFFDLTGKLMQTTQLTNETTEILTTNLSNGIYLYQVLGANGIEGIGKVVIAK